MFTGLPNGFLGLIQYYVIIATGVKLKLVCVDPLKLDLSTSWGYMFRA